MSAQLNDLIGYLYDRSSPLWERVWGEHMHHGFYPPRAKGAPRMEPHAAQLELIEQLLRWGGVRAAANVLDVGCGIGGSALHLATRFDAAVTGITLSAVQAARATARAQVRAGS